MADDSLENQEETEFHPCDTPRGSLYYDLTVLTAEQQDKLNGLKRATIREDEIYLAAHPEIRAIIALILRHVFKYHPRTELNTFVARFFMRDRSDIEDEIEEYLQGRKGHVYRGDSAVVMEPEFSSETLIDFEQLSLKTEKEKKDKMEAEYISAEVLSIVIENMVEKIEEIERQDAEYIRQFLMNDLVDKIGDRVKDDFKSFVIEEILKRVMPYIRSENASLADHFSQELIQD